MLSRLPERALTAAETNLPKCHAVLLSRKMPNLVPRGLFAMQSPLRSYSELFASL